MGITQVTKETLIPTSRFRKNEFSAKAFHDRYDHVKNTLTIVLSTRELKGEFIYDGGKKAFLLFLSHKEKYIPLHGNRLVKGMPIMNQYLEVQFCISN